MRTLIVEDEVSSCIILQKFLSPFGKCLIAVNGDVGIRLFREGHEKKEPFELICLDIMMPGKDGFTVLKEIRQWEEQHALADSEKVKVIITTALTDIANKTKSLKEKCDGYLVKPVEKKDLIQLIQSFGLVKSKLYS